MNTTIQVIEARRGGVVEESTQVVNILKARESMRDTIVESRML